MLSKLFSQLNEKAALCDFVNSPKSKEIEPPGARCPFYAPQRLQGEAQRRSRGFCEVANHRGFTLIEIMVVIIILGILAMYVAP